MSVSAATIAKAAASLLSDGKTRGLFGKILIALIAPVLVVVSLLCSIGVGGAQHNNHTVSACFYGTAYSQDIPREFKAHIEDMRMTFSLLDSATAAANAWSESGSIIDPLWVKSIFFGMCFGDDVPSRRAAANFVSCFYEIEERTRTYLVEQEDGTFEEETETYTVAVPVTQQRALQKVEAQIGRVISSNDKKNIDYIYAMVAGSVGGEGSYGGTYLRGSGNALPLDISAFADPRTKNAADLVAYVKYAWESGWGYVWGTYGDMLTEETLAFKVKQYPQGVGNYEPTIRARWLNKHTVDCVGLIKGYGWLDPESMTINYGSGTMPDIGANEMYYSASVSGSIDTMPDTPGLAVWKDGHIGVYIGNGEVIEAMGTKYGVVKTELDGRGWTHWLKIEYISYE